MPLLYVQESRKDYSKCSLGEGGVLPYIVKVCVQLYKQEGSLCAFLGLQQYSLTVRSKRGSGYWCLSSLGLSYYTSINYNHQLLIRNYSLLITTLYSFLETCLARIALLKFPFPPQTHKKQMSLVQCRLNATW